jgi:hypothetical protein
VKTIDVEIMDTSEKISVSKLNLGVQSTQKKFGNESKVALEDKVYIETCYSHKPRSVIVDKTLAKIKAHEL